MHLVRTHLLADMVNESVSRSIMELKMDLELLRLELHRHIRYGSLLLFI